jgi:hypothetical protein
LAAAARSLEEERDAALDELERARAERDTARVALDAAENAEAHKHELLVEAWDQRDTARTALEAAKAVADTYAKQLETAVVTAKRALDQRDAMFEATRERCAQLVEGRNTGCDGTDACAANQAAAIRDLTLEET